jgi:hypothetical protein
MQLGSADNMLGICDVERCDVERRDSGSQKILEHQDWAPWRGGKSAEGPRAQGPRETRPRTKLRGAPPDLANCWLA